VVEELVALGERRAAPRVAARLVEELSRPGTDLPTRDRVRAYGEALVSLGDATALDDIRSRIERQGDAGLASYLRGLTSRLQKIRDIGDDVAGWAGALAADDEAVRRLAIERLEALGSPDAVAALDARFEAASPPDRARILRAFGRIADARALPRIRTVLLSPEYDVGLENDLRRWAAWAAWRLGDEEAASALEEAARRRDGRDAEVLVRLALLRGPKVASRIESYRVPRLERVGLHAGPDQDRLDALVRDLRAGRPLDRYEREPEVAPVEIVPLEAES
jgi:HEAT repeat protein